MDFSLGEAERELVALCRDFAEKEIASRAPEAWEEGRCPTDLLRGDGRARIARHARPRDVGRDRHVDGGLRGGHGAAWPGGPVRRCGVAGPRHYRLVAAVALRRRRTTRALVAPAWQKDGRSGVFGLTEPDAGSDARGIQTRARAPGRRLADQRPQDVHLQRRDGHVVRGHAAGPDATRAMTRRRVRQLRRREGHAGFHHGSQVRGHRVARASTRGSSTSMTSGSPAITWSAIPRWGSPIPADARGRTDLHRRPLAEPHAGRARHGDPVRRGSECSSANRSRSSKPCNSSWPTSPPSSRRLAGSPIVPRRCATRAAVPEGGGHGETEGESPRRFGGVGSGPDPWRARLHAESPVARFYCDAKVLEIGEGTNEIQHVVIARALGC